MYEREIDLCQNIILIPEAALSERLETRVLNLDIGHVKVCMAREKVKNVAEACAILALRRCKRAIIKHLKRR